MRKKGQLSAGEQSENPWKCASCGADVPPPERKRWLKDSALKPLPIQHCEGSRAAFGCFLFQPHHTAQPWTPCWKCSSPMGCRVCVDYDPICIRCIVKTDRDGFIHNGPISNDPYSIRARDGKIAPGLDAYPWEWRERYRMLTAAPFNVSDDELYAAWKAAERKQGAALPVMPTTPTTGQLRAKRNQQVAAQQQPREPGES